MSEVRERPTSIDQHRADYQRDGAICTRKAVDPKAAQALLDHFATLPKSGDRFADDMDLYKKGIPDYWDFIAPLTPLAASLMGTGSVRFYNDHLFVKPAGSQAPTRWHQDLPYWPFTGDQIIAAWIAMTPVRFEGGALQYIKGSHRRGWFFQPSEGTVPDTSDPDYLALVTPPDFFDPAERAKEEFLSWEMEPGDVLWHHSLAVHGAFANATGASRAGLTVRFLGDDVRWDPRSYLREANASLGKGDPLSGDPETFPLLWSATG
ncbi:MAG: hypothetical protein JWO33_2192 [Caulobacteraceae bacterium]|nr:hypothetical protein [Caulobacteraceae bacterium]